MDDASWPPHSWIIGHGVPWMPAVLSGSSGDVEFMLTYIELLLFDTMQLHPKLTCNILTYNYHGCKHQGPDSKQRQ